MKGITEAATVLFFTIYVLCDSEREGFGVIAHDMMGLRQSNTFRNTAWMLVTQ